MGFHSSPARRDAQQQWRNFLSADAKVIDAAGLSPEFTNSISAWDEFLSREDSKLIDRLSEQQRAALLQLVDSYFAAGYSYFTPYVLPQQEIDVLESRYGPAEEA